MLAPPKGGFSGRTVVPLAGGQLEPLEPAALQGRPSGGQVQSDEASTEAVAHEDDGAASEEEVWCGASGSVQLDFHTLLKSLADLHDHEVAELRAENLKLAGLRPGQAAFPKGPAAASSPTASSSSAWRKPSLNGTRSREQALQPWAAMGGVELDQYLLQDGHRPSLTQPRRLSSSQPRRLSALEDLRDLQHVYSTNSEPHAEAPKRSSLDEAASSRVKIEVVPPAAAIAEEDVAAMSATSLSSYRGARRITAPAALTKFGVLLTQEQLQKPALGAVAEDAAKEEASSTPSRSASAVPPSRSRRYSVEEIEKDSRDFEVLPPWQPEKAKCLQRRVSVARRTAVHGHNVPCATPTALEDTGEGSSVFHSLVLHPSSPKRLAWDIMSMSLLGYDIIVIPFVGAFDPPSDAFRVGMTWFTLCFWTLDSPISFFTGYHSGKQTIMDPKKVFMRYLFTWMFMDWLIICLDWSLVMFEPGDDAGSAARLGRTFRFLRFIRTLRLIRVLKLKKIVQTIQDLINTETVSICFGIIKIVLSLVIANHLVACCWYSIGSFGEENGVSWITVADIDRRPLMYRYMTSLHWSLTQFTPASMEVFPQTLSERVYSVVILLFAMIAFSSFVSMLTASMVELKKISSDESQQFWLLRRYLRDWGVRRDVSLRIQRYLEYAYQQQRQRVQEKDVTLLHLLSEPLKEDLKVETFSRHFSNHPLFSRCDDKTRIFGTALATTSLASGDRLFCCGEHASRAIYVTSGTLAYTLGELGDNNESLTIHGNTSFVSEGFWVSESVLWTIWLHLGDLQALTESQVITVDAKRFGGTIQNNRPLWLVVHQYARSFVDELNKVKRQDLTDLTHQLFKPPSAQPFETGRSGPISAPAAPAAPAYRLQRSATMHSTDSNASSYAMLKQTAVRTSQRLLNGVLDVSGLSTDVPVSAGSFTPSEGVLPDGSVIPGTTLS